MLSELRMKLNEIDQEIIKLLIERFEVTDAVGAYKKTQKMVILQPEREREIINRISEAYSDSAYVDYIVEVYLKIFEQSRNQQAKYLED